MKKEKIGNILQMQRGYDLPSSQMNEGEIPVVGSNGIVGYHDVSRCIIPTITIGRSGSAGKVHIYNTPTWVHNTALYLTDFKGNNPQYLYYLLQLLHLEKLCGSSVIPSLNRNVVYPMIVNFHEDRSEQDAIAYTLSLIDEKIVLNREINRNLEAMARQLYDYWFVQFDFPDENGRPYKSSGGKMVWNEKLKREIPEGWTVKRIKAVTDVLLGGTPETSNAEYWNGNIPWLNSGEVADFPILSSEKTITELGRTKSATAYAPKGSVTLSITRHLRPSILGIDACINQSVVAIKETGLFRNALLYPYLLNEIPRLMSLRTGAQQPHINKEIVEDSNILLIHSDLLQEYYSIAQPMFDSIIENAREINQLMKQRDVILPLLMNGQVSVMPPEVNCDLSHD